MPIQRNNPAATSARSLTNGFPHLLAKLWSEKNPVKVSLINGHTYEGMIVDVDGGISALEISVDRFNKEILYIPIGSMVFVSTAMTEDSNREENN